MKLPRIIQVTLATTLLTIVTATGTSEAATIKKNVLTSNGNANSSYNETLIKLNIIKPIQKPTKKAEVKKPALKKEQEPQPVNYVVSDGDTLTSIAENNNTTVDRIWSKNDNLSNPDVISTGDTITIPTATEQLPTRDLPVEPVVQDVTITTTPVPVYSQSQQVAKVSSTSTAYYSGNTYDYGYCTYYSKNRRPDLPNNLGNANTWAIRASAQGLPTGYVPKAGAIAVSTAGAFGHVVYVESVNADGTFNLSEMNYGAWNVISSRSNVSPSGWSFIY